MWATFLTALAIGVACETGAALGRFWVYRRPLYRVLNVVLVFGLVMGGIATLAGRLGLGGVFAAGFSIGLAYEALNLAWLDWWFFPDDRLLVLRGRPACAAGVAVAWGLVPVAIALARGLA